MLRQIKAPQFNTDLGLQKTVLVPLANSKIQGLFKAFECFSSTFQGKFYFQGLVKTVLYIQVLFKPVKTLLTHKHMGCRFSIYSLFMDIHNSFMDIHNSFMDIQK